MSLFRLDKNYFDSFKILTAPKRTFTSGSGQGVTGAIKVFPLASLGMKEVPQAGDPDSPPLADSLEEYRLSVLAAGEISSGSLNEYMSMVNAAGVSARRQKEVEILRFEPSFRFTSDTLRKRTIQEVLFPFYRSQYGSTCNWAFTNYHTLNFFNTGEPLL